jgi:hypothetical protein
MTLATTSTVGKGVRVGNGVTVGSAGVDVEVWVGVAVGVGVSVEVGAGVGLDVSVGVGEGGSAVGVSVAGIGFGVCVGGRRVGVKDGEGVTVAAGWLGSGHKPTASKKNQAVPCAHTKTVMVEPVALAETVKSGHESIAHSDGPQMMDGDSGSVPPVGSRPSLRSEFPSVTAAQPASA